MTPHRDWFYTYEPIFEVGMFMGNDHTLEIVGIDTFKLKMHDGTIHIIQGVQYVKGLKKNLLSIGKLDDLGCKIHTEGGILKVVKGNLVVMKVEKIMANLYMLLGDMLQVANPSIATSSQEEATIMRHHRLGHISKPDLEVLVDCNLLLGLKMIRFVSVTTRFVTKRKGKIKGGGLNQFGLGRNVWESPVLSLGGAKYFVSFIDDYSRRLWVYPIKTKSSVFSQFKEFKAQVELETGKKIKCLRIDNGGEYINGDFLEFYKQEGITRQFIIPHTPQQNGVVEDE
ncbi:hypothetical protein CR513_23121, partial [Mucuna pruriens]